MNKQTVKNGIDRTELLTPLLHGWKVGLITNPTGMNKDFVSTIDILREMGVLACLFSPEHGVRGEHQAGAKVTFYTDEKTGVPVHSTYGGNPHIPPEILQTLDALVYDIQDVGARYYTYVYTLSYAMEDCAAAGKPLVILDRVNPVGGKMEGTILERPFSSFVGRYPIPSRYGLTVGEFARYINETEHIGCDLRVIPLEGWTRDTFYDETDLPWVSPSPNIPTVDSAFAYLCTCLFEGTNLSEGRGTTHPFEWIGAPWLNSSALAETFNALNLPGVKLRECHFTPTFSKHKDTLCHGVQVHITDRRAFKPFETGLRLLLAIKDSHKEFAFLPPWKEGSPAFIDLLLGTDALRREDFDLEVFLKEQQAKVQAFENAVKPYLLYP